MMFTTEMIQLFAVALERDRQPVTEALLREGVMQFVSMTELDRPQGLTQVEPEMALSKVTDLRRRIEGLLHTIGTIPIPPQESDLGERVSLDLDKESERLDQLDQEREAVRERQRSLHQEILKIEDIKRQVDLYGLDLSGVKLPSQNSLLSTQTGKVPLAKRQTFTDEIKRLPVLNLVLGEDEECSHHLLLFMKRDRDALDRILAQAGWAKFELPGEMLSQQKNLLRELTGKLEALQGEQARLQDQVDELVKGQRDHLSQTWTQLRINELCARIQVNFQTSSRAILFAGWLPASKKDSLTEAVTQASEGRCYLEWAEPRSSEQIGEEIPVQFKNPKALGPFQMLVSNFGVPEYGTIDPTPFVMPLYLAMFGLMFADAGQGVVLAILGALGIRSFKRDAAKKGMEQLCWLIVWCGISSIVFGVLLGSYFGMQWFKPLWFDFHGIVLGHEAHGMVSDVLDILAVTIHFGIAVILLGLGFNWINLVRMRRYDELIFDKGGLLGGWIYLGGIYIAAQYVSSGYKSFPSGNVMFLLTGLPALLLFIKEPYHYVTHGSHDENKPPIMMAVMNWLMEWVVELLEIFSGYLSNTLSFMRVAGLGIAHVCLMVSFFTLADMAGGLFGIVILILGNVLVIGLEGLSAGIQALRLNYYEFFTKFFHGSGKLHTPISLRSEL